MPLKVPTKIEIRVCVCLYRYLYSGPDVLIIDGLCCLMTGNTGLCVCE